MAVHLCIRKTVKQTMISCNDSLDAAAAAAAMEDARLQARLPEMAIIMNPIANESVRHPPLDVKHPGDLHHVEADHGVVVHDD